MKSHFEHESTTAGAFLAGLLCGAAVGAALGLAFAPRAGAEIRRQLAESGGRMRASATRTYTQASAGVGQLMSHGRDALDRGRAAFGRSRERARTAGTETPDTARWDEESPAATA